MILDSSRIYPYPPFGSREKRKPNYANVALENLACLDRALSSIQMKEPCLELLNADRGISHMLFQQVVEILESVRQTGTPPLENLPTKRAPFATRTLTGVAGLFSARASAGAKKQGAALPFSACPACWQDTGRRRWPHARRLLPPPKSGLLMALARAESVLVGGGRHPVAGFEQGAKVGNVVAAEHLADLFDAEVAVAQQVHGDVHPLTVPVGLRGLAVFQLEKHAQAAGRVAALPAELLEPKPGPLVLINESAQLGGGRRKDVRALVDDIPDHISHAGLHPHQAGGTRRAEGLAHAQELAFPSGDVLMADGGENGQRHRFAGALFDEIHRARLGPHRQPRQIQLDRPLVPPGRAVEGEQRPLWQDRQGGSRPDMGCPAHAHACEARHGERDDRAGQLAFVALR